MGFKSENDYACRLAVQMDLKIYGQSRITVSNRNTVPMRTNEGLQKDSSKNEFTSSDLDPNGCQINIL